MFRWIILGIMLLGFYSKGYPQDVAFHLKETTYIHDSLDCIRLLYKIEVTHASMEQFRTYCNGMYQLTFGWKESCQHLDPPNEKCSQYCQFFDDLLNHGSFFQPGQSLYIVSTCVPEEFVRPCIEFVKEYLDVEQIDPEKFEEGVQNLFSFIE